MGIPENAAKHALFNTGNNSPDMAVAWYFDNMDNPILNEPLRVKKAPAGGSSQVNTSASQVSQDVVDQLMQFGFSEKKVRKALAATDNNPDRAGEWLFSHMDDPESDHEMTEVFEGA